MMMEDLDPNLTADILSRLPLKSLLRCRCVCKQWRSVISSHPIIASRCGHGYSSGFFVFAMGRPPTFNASKMAFIRNLGQDMANREFSSLCESQHHFMDSTIPISMCNGLMFCNRLNLQQGNCSVGSYIYNPETTEYILLPEASVEGDCVVSGLAFDPAACKDNIASYKIVIGGSKSTPAQFQFKVYSSETRVWHETRLCCQEPRVCQRLLIFTPHSVFYHGILHWLLDVDSVLTFDPETETSRWVDMPNGGNLEMTEIYPLARLAEWGGELYYVRIGANLGLDIWKTSDYSCCSTANVKWVLLHSTDRFVPHVVENVRTFLLPNWFMVFPVAVDKEGDIVLFSTYTCQMILYDTRSGRIIRTCSDHCVRKLAYSEHNGPWYMHYIPTRKFLSK